MLLNVVKALKHNKLSDGLSAADGISTIGKATSHNYDPI